jgi:hypothetical protein
MKERMCKGNVSVCLCMCLCVCVCVCVCGGECEGASVRVYVRVGLFVCVLKLSVALVTSVESFTVKGLKISQIFNI